MLLKQFRGLLSFRYLAQRNRFGSERAFSSNIFVQAVDPRTGRMSWKVTNEDEFDYHQAIAASNYGDMLHDKERNEKYYMALRKVIAQMHQEGREVHVLDIGTGTGLLSMMAAQAGADTVTACECFTPMAHCAEHIIAKNGFADKIRLIKKRSSEVQIGADMPQRANLLVAELLDTELIGEGALEIYNDAHDRLLTQDVICIPAKANCYAQVVESPLAAQWSKLKILPDLDGEPLLYPSDVIAKCPGSRAVHDLQLSQVPQHLIMPMAGAPIRIFEFDFNSKAPRPYGRSVEFTLKSLRPGSVDLVLYWWEIEMDKEAEILLSCAPYEYHPLKDVVQPTPEQTARGARNVDLIPWRDHWIQAIYFLPQPLKLPSKDMEFKLNCNHDRFSLWFNAYQSGHEDKVQMDAQDCTCWLHIMVPRRRFGQWNHAKRNKLYIQCIENADINSNSTVLVIGSASLLGLSVAAQGAGHVIVLDPEPLTLKALEDIAIQNKLSSKVTLAGNKKDLLEKISEERLASVTHVFAEPHFSNAELPWDNMLFLKQLLDIYKELPANVRIIPRGMRIKMLPVEFLNLHKIRQPVGIVEGFDLSYFDEIIEKSRARAVDSIEPQSLWEYPCYAVGEPVDLVYFGWDKLEGRSTDNGDFLLKESGKCNGIVLWVDWVLDEKLTVPGGSYEPIVPGALVNWDMFSRQGVHFLPETMQLRKDESHIKWSVSYSSKGLKLSFQVQP